MLELLRLNDPVRLSFLEALLRDGSVESFVLDHHMSVLEGSAVVIPRRLMVRDEDATLARYRSEAGRGCPAGALYPARGGKTCRRGRWRSLRKSPKTRCWAAR